MANCDKCSKPHKRVKSNICTACERADKYNKCEICKSDYLKKYKTGKCGNCFLKTSATHWDEIYYPIER